MEKKVEIVTKTGRIVRVMPHMLSDMARFDATVKKPMVKDVPKELLTIPKKTVLPKMEVTEQPKEVPPEEVKVRKTPVKSKSK